MHLSLHRVRRASISCSLVSLGLVAGAASAQTIVGLGVINKVERGIASSLSDDGSIIGGSLWLMQGLGSTKACVWRRKTDGLYEREIVGNLFAGRNQDASVSHDGLTVTLSYGGYPLLPPTQAVFYRCQQIALGVRVWGQLMPFTDGTPFELHTGSPDGVTYLGATIEGDARHSFIWSAAPGSPPPRSLQPLPGFERSMAHDVSRGWRVVIGGSISGAVQVELATPTRWVDGVPERIEAPEGLTTARATRVSTDGSAIIGYASDGHRATLGVLWREGTPPVVIHGPRRDTAITIPYALSADGSIVVGWSRDERYIGYIDRPWLWTDRTGTLDFNVLVDQLGGEFAHWRIVHASQVTPDGRTMLGGGFHNGQYESFVMTLPALCTADFDNDGDVANGGMPNFAVGIEDLIYFLNRFEVGDPRLDLDDGNGSGQGDGAVDIADLLYFLARFEEGC